MKQKNEMMYKIVATDLDGTLVRADQTISSQTVDILTKLDSLGVLFLPSNGRAAFELPDCLSSLPFLKYVSFCNGACIYDFVNKEFIDGAYIENDMLLKLLEYAKENGLYPNVVSYGKRYVEATSEGTADVAKKEYIPKNVADNTTAVDDLYMMFVENGKNAQKLLYVIDDSMNKSGIMDDMQQKFSDLDITSSGRYNIEINHKDANNGEALTMLCDKLHIDIKETIGFGDNDNDITLLDAAGLSIVTENGNENAKRHADRITCSCEDDGVTKALEEIFFGVNGNGNQIKNGD